MNANRFWAAALIVFALTTAASADVKIVAEVKTKGVPAELNVGGAQGTDKPKTTTTYYKGDKVRTEVDGLVTITENATGKTYTLDPKKKTFTVVTIQEIEKQLSNNPLLSMVQVQTQTTVTPTDKTRTIAGKTAKLYNYTTVLNMKLTGGDETMAAFASMLPTVTIKGEQWTTEQIMVPALSNPNVLKNIARMQPMLASGLKEAVEKLQAIRGFYLSSVVTTLVEMPRDAPAGFGAGVPREPIVLTTEVKSISEEPLDDALFTVPADYKEEKPVASPTAAEQG